jgi:hypothetical protein
VPLIGFSRLPIDRSRGAMPVIRVPDDVGAAIRGAIEHDGRCDERHLPLLRELARDCGELAVLVATIELGSRVFVCAL